MDCPVLAGSDVAWKEISSKNDQNQPEFGGETRSGAK
jgi:hypothetical protein